MDDILVVEDSLLHTHHLLQHELMIDGELSIAVGQVLDLLLLSHDLLVQEIDLLCWDRVVMVASLFTGRRRFPSNVVQRLLAVGPELRVLKLPSLCTIRILYVQERSRCRLRWGRMVIAHSPRYSAALCGSRTCSAGERNWQSCCA